jgi:phosphoglycolate phosphatase
VNRVDLLIFDLDGTLIDSRRDLANAGNATRIHMGMPPLEDERVCSYVGNGAPVLVRRLLGSDATEVQVQEGLEFFIEYYGDHKLDCTTLYPGVPQALDRLRDAGVSLAVLTNKPVRISRAIMAGLGIEGHFRQIYGGNSFDFKKPNPIGVETLMAECAAGRERTMMVGDSSVDVETARNASVKSCRVSFGFEAETTAMAPPDLRVDRMEELADWVTGATVS